jgi:TolA-binding protein
MDPNQNLEPLFCDLCNMSVPLPDLESGAARRCNDRIVGACCMRVLLPKQEVREAGSQSKASGVAVVLVLAAIAGATIFLDKRIGEEVTGVEGKISHNVDGALVQHGARLAAIEGRVTTTVEKSDLKGLSDRLTQLEQHVSGSLEKTEALSGRLDGLQGQIAKTQADQLATKKEQSEAAQRHDQALQAIATDLQQVKAMPRATEQPPPSVAEPAMPRVEPSGPTLSKELAHHVSSLTDSDPGVRFQAVSALIESKSPLVREPLLTMVKDPDLFVRRVTLEGLRNFRHASCVEALLTALADPESLVRHTAFQSLKSLTAGTIAFDPNGTQPERASAVRKWREWWDDNKKSF